MNMLGLKTVLQRSAALAAAAALLLSVSGCSQTTHFYTLAPMETGAALTPPGAAHTAVIAVGPVTIPDYVNRPQIVVRTSATEVKQASFDQWAGDLDEMIPRLLVEDLGARLPTDRFVVFPQISDLAFDYRIPISISRFDVSPSGGAVIVARWQVRHGATDKIVVHESHAHADAVGNGYEDMVAALSRAIAILTDEIAADLASMPRGEVGAAKAPSKATK